MVVITDDGTFKAIGIDLQTSYEGLCRIHFTDEQAKELNVIGFIYKPLKDVVMILEG